MYTNIETILKSLENEMAELLEIEPKDLMESGKRADNYYFLENIKKTFKKIESEIENLNEMEDETLKQRKQELLKEFSETIPDIELIKKFQCKETRTKRLISGMDVEMEEAKEYWINPFFKENKNFERWVMVRETLLNWRKIENQNKKVYTNQY